MAHVRRLEPGDVSRCLEIVGGLPESFTNGVPEAARRDVERHPAWVVEDGDGVLGFAVVDRRSSEAAEILWAAVAAERRHAGLGTRLVESVLGGLREDGVRLVEVKTLDRRAGYPPYEATRAFWERTEGVRAGGHDRSHAGLAGGEPRGRVRRRAGAGLAAGDAP